MVGEQVECKETTPQQIEELETSSPEECTWLFWEEDEVYDYDLSSIPFAKGSTTCSSSSGLTYPEIYSIEARHRTHKCSFDEECNSSLRACAVNITILGAASAQEMSGAIVDLDDPESNFFKQVLIARSNSHSHSQQDVKSITETSESCGTNTVWLRDQDSEPNNLHIHRVVLASTGGAWGTGEHPTTILVCRWLLRHPHLVRNKRVMDYGCGSGVLGIVSALLGAAEVVGVDISPAAVDIAKINVKASGVEDKMCVYLPPQAVAEKTLDYQTRAHLGLKREETSSCSISEEITKRSSRAQARNTTEFLELSADTIHQFDVILSNIVPGPLISVAGTIATLAKPSGVVALTGCFSQLAPRVKEAYQEHGIYVNEADVEDGWTLLVGQSGGT